jgi:hypothetical protein
VERIEEEVGLSPKRAGAGEPHKVEGAEEKRGERTETAHVRSS